MIRRAVEICGGATALCIRLGVSEHRLLLWLEGRARLPEQVFLSLADVILEDDVARASSDRRKQPRVEAIKGDAQPAAPAKT